VLRTTPLTVFTAALLIPVLALGSMLFSMASTGGINNR
jgi:hypothetical protein